MAGLSRYMAVLRLFSEGVPTWTVAEMADALGVPQSTAYRTVRDLLSEGLVEMSSEARYRLGPAFIEFDRLTRLTVLPVERSFIPALLLEESFLTRVDKNLNPLAKKLLMRS